MQRVHKKIEQMDFSIMGAGGEATPSGGSLPTLLSFLNDSSGANALTFIATLAVLIGLNFIWELIVDVLEAVCKRHFITKINDFYARDSPKLISNVIENSAIVSLKKLNYSKLRI